MSEVFDAVVVGAGPAGSAAAIALGRAGRTVLLLDRKAFPRDKPCGDLIGARAMRVALRLGVPALALGDFSRIGGAVVTSDGGPLDLAPGSAWGRRLLAGSDARVVPRAVFDHLLVESAVRAGATLRQAAVSAVGPWDNGSRVVEAQDADGHLTIMARAVVLAGGYGCRVAADVAPGPRDDRPQRGIAMRGYFRGVSCPTDRIVFSLDRWLLPGYGWVFPLPDGGANVGVGRLVSPAEAGDNDPHLRDLWRRYAEDARSPAAHWLDGAEGAGRPRAWPLDLGPRRRRLVADGLVVAGEAAGLVGPLTGAGIAFALESGELAGQAIAAALANGNGTRDELAPYGLAIRRKSAPWLRAELLVQRFLSNPERTERFFAAIRPLPPTGALGARLLLQLG
jgi:geranylgeranyl reductase family protein